MIRQYIQKLAVSAVFIGSGMATTAFAIEPFQATYNFSYNGKNMGTATRVLQQKSGDNWTYVFSAKAGMIASASETSQFSFLNGQVNSQDFSRTSKILVHQDKFTIHYNPANKTVSTVKKSTPRSFAWQPNALDELNAEVQIREDLIKGQLKPSYLLTDAKGIESRKFIKEGNASIQTPYGTFDTIKVRMQHSRPEKSTIFWLAPKLNYLPVKITHNDESTSYGLVLTQYQDKK